MACLTRLPGADPETCRYQGYSFTLASESTTGNVWKCVQSNCKAKLHCNNDDSNCQLRGSHCHRTPSSPRKRGRPKKLLTAPSDASSLEESEDSDSSVSSSPPPKKMASASKKKVDNKLKGKIKSDDDDDLIEEVYHSVVEIDKRDNKNNLHQLWKCNFDCIESTRKQFHYPDVDFSNTPEAPIAAKKIRMRNIDKKGGLLQTERAFTLPDVVRLPVVYTWLPTQKNHAAEDEEALTHVPYIAGDDTHFLAEVHRLYQGGVRGGQGGGKEFFSDTMFFQVVNKLANKFDKDSSPKSCVSPALSLFQAISKRFPDKGTANELQTKYVDLKEKYKKKTVQEPSDTTMPDLDTSGDLPFAASAERAMHSYMSLLCRRCYRYDCPLHGNTSIAVPQIRRKPRKTTPSEPCGPNCFLATRQEKKNGDLSVHVPARPINWTNRDVTMCRVLRTAMMDDSCAIAQMLGNKPCKEVYKFIACDTDCSEADAAALSPTSANKKNRSKQNQHHRWRTIKWTSQDDRGTVHNAHSYIPCHHEPGVKCSKETCRCVQLGTSCMKFCHCSNTCDQRFPGCRCKATCNTRQCPCWFAKRECDPDLCDHCGAGDLSGEKINCRNVCIQRGWKKHLLLAPSDVAGYGCFVKTAARKGELISEYCGEVVSQEEGERRGKLYDRLNCSYLFGLNREMDVDATRKGNKIRFANHSVHPNCHAQVMMVNGDHRIGIFASKDIAAGEELFFDYRYNKAERIKFVNIERK